MYLLVVYAYEITKKKFKRITNVPIAQLSRFIMKSLEETFVMFREVMYCSSQFLLLGVCDVSDTGHIFIYNNKNTTIIVVHFACNMHTYT